MATVTIDLNAMPYQKSFQIIQGDGLEWPVHFKIKTEAATTYSDLSLVGCSLKLYVSKGTTAVIAGTAVTLDTAASGKFTLRIAGATTVTWSGDYKYEIEATFPAAHANFSAGLVKTLLEGRIRVRGDL